MIEILGGMGTQAGLDFSTKLAKLYRGKLDQKHPLFILYNKSNVPKRLADKKFYKKVLKIYFKYSIIYFKFHFHYE